MRKFYIFKSVLLVVAGFFMTMTVKGQESLLIKTGDLELEPGGTVQLEAEYTNNDGEITEVDIVWHAEPGYLGKVNRDDIFTAGHPGEGFIYARYRELKDSVKLVVKGTPKEEEENGDVDEEENEDDYPKVKVVPGLVKIAVDDSVELIAFYINELDEKEEATFTWSVFPPELGEFPDVAQSKFFAGEPGKGIIVASANELADTIKLWVYEPKDKKPHEAAGKKIVITPGDTVINAGDPATLQYSAKVKTTGNKPGDEDLIWSLSGDPIGNIDESTGLLTLSGETGLALVKATYGNFRAWVELLVLDPEADTEVNTIKIHRVLPDGNELPAKSFKEGDSYRIGGLPFPLNILNGGMLHFPFGCISEDIVIYMFIPEEYAEMDMESDEVTFEEEIITGVKFSVKPVTSESIVEPYYFDIPLNLALTFKRGLLDSLGIDPENLDVFFAENTGFVTDGAGNVAVDTVKNKIYAAIEHFSTIVVRPKSQETYARELQRDPDATLTVFPNPFTQSTRISFRIREKSDIDLSVYNLSGQKVKTLVTENLNEGMYSVTWEGRNDEGKLMSPGIYFCRLVKNGRGTEVKRMVLHR
jgi:hypothetical protein